MKPLTISELQPFSITLSIHPKYLRVSEMKSTRLNGKGCTIKQSEVLAGSSFIDFGDM